MSLKKAKMSKAEANKLYAAAGMLDQQHYLLEENQFSKEVFMAMQEGKKAVSQIQAEVQVEKVEDMLADMEEHQQINSEIQNAFGRFIENDDDLMAELDDMIAEDEVERMPVGAEQIQPSVEVAKQEPKPTTAEEEAELEAMMAL